MDINSEHKVVSTFYATILLVIILCLLGIFLFYWKNRHYYKMATRIPNYGSSNRMDLGLSFVGKTNEENFMQVIEFFRTSPEVFKVWLGYFFAVGISKPEHVEIVLNNANSVNKSAFVEYTNPYMGEGLFTARKDKWKKHRKLLNPTFNQKILNSFVPVFSEKCDILMEELKGTIGQPNIDIMEVFSRYSLDTVCETTMGLRVNAQTSSNHYGELLNRFFEIVTSRIFNIFHHSDFIFYSSELGKESLKVVGELNGYCEKVIKKRRESYEEKMQEEYIDDEEATRRKSVLDRMLEITYNGKQFTNKELRDEVHTIIAGGTDTSSATMAFCCLTLGLFPEHQQKVYEEAMEVLGPDRYPTEDDIPKLKYLELFIKETLRVFPIAPLLIRATTADIKLDDLVIPKDCIIFMGLLHLHRNPKYWEDPLKFDPYRFLPEEWSKKHPYSYLPFSGGPRNCIGSRYAMMLMKVVLSKVVRKFRITTDYKSIEEVDLKIKLMSRPVKGFKTYFELRE